MPTDDGRNKDPEIIQDFKVFWDDSFKEKFDESLETSHYKRVDVRELSGGIPAQDGYVVASGLGGDARLIGGRGGETGQGGEIALVGGAGGAETGFAQGENSTPRTLNPDTGIAIGYNAKSVMVDSLAFGSANKSCSNKIALGTSAVYYGSFTVGYSIYSDILNTIETTCQEDDLDLLVEEGQEKLFGIETFFTIEGEEQIVSDWRDSWLSYIGNLED
jgi:hypothetical protein